MTDTKHKLGELFSVPFFSGTLHDVSPDALKDIARAMQRLCSVAMVYGIKLTRVEVERDD